MTRYPATRPAAHARLARMIGTDAGANVQITIDIDADLPDGAGDKLVRDVTENCRTLKLTDYGFEED